APSCWRCLDASPEAEGYGPSISTASEQLLVLVVIAAVIVLLKASHLLFESSHLRAQLSDVPLQLLSLRCDLFFDQLSNELPHLLVDHLPLLSRFFARIRSRLAM